MIVRPAAPADMAALAAVHAACFPRPWSAADLKDMAARPGALALLAEGEGPCGFILCWRVVDEAEVLTIAVRQQARGRGVGWALLASATAQAAQAGALACWLEVAEDNAPAIALYRRAGFEEQGRRRGYYGRAAPESSVDAIVLRRRLTAPAEALILG